tara:strand:+ start:1212 stop:2111 length:900 start_codon:yes stop_codon:yes gene_type:complete
MKSLKTPLRYPGGKSRACTKLDQFLPDLNKYKEFHEPFLGGGSVSLHVSKKYPHLKICANDLYEPLVNFWSQLQDNGVELSEKLKSLKSKHNDPDTARVLFTSSKECIDSSDSSSFDRAVAFYIINKCSFSGLTESSSFSSQASNSNFSFRGIEKLPEYSELIENWEFTNKDYTELLTDSRSVFTYLDPPYEIGSHLYGKKGSMHKNFDHDKFAQNCDDCTGHQLISYNSSQLIRDRFKGWDAAEFKLTYTMRSVGDYMKDQQDRKELVLFNYGINPKIQFTFNGCYNYNRLKSEGLAS